MAARLHLIRWGLPAFALIFGLFWYKRRRVSPGDPGGKSDSDRALTGATSAAELQGVSEDEGLHSPSQSPISEPQSKLSCSSPLEHSLNINSPRKSPDNLSSQVRRSPPQPIIFTKSVVERHHRSADWYVEDDDEVIQQLDRTDPVLANKTNMAAKKHQVDEPVRPHGQATPIEAPLIEDNQLKMEANKAEVEAKVGQANSVQAMELEAKPQIGEAEEHAKVNEVKEDNEAKDGEHNEIRSQVEERDSANHSPVSGVLEGSVTDEVRSEGSTDSGKGGSIKGHAISSNQTYYDFFVPNFLVGRLIGRHGSTLNTIKAKSGARINIKKKPAINEDCSICVVEGTPEAIQLALAHIRKMFPVARYPSFTMDQLIKIPEEVLQPASFTCLSLVEGINNDIIVCSVIKPNRFFVQIPTHPSYPALKTLDDNMTQFYNAYDSPAVPAELGTGQVVAVYLFDKWMRAMIVEPDPNGEATTVRLLDHGGYWSVSHSAMRQIRNDYLSLPFQAIEVYLANVKSKTPEWDSQAYVIVQQISCSVVGQAQIVAYYDNNPYVNLFFSIRKHGLISLAEELIGRGFAEHVPLEEMVQEAWSMM